MSAPTPPPTHRMTRAGVRPISAATKAKRRADDAEREVLALRAELGLHFPTTRADCPTFRPCPFVSCRYHIQHPVTDRHQAAAVLDPDDWQDDTPTCALDVADAPDAFAHYDPVTIPADGMISLTGVARIVGTSRQNMQQMERRAMDRMRANAPHLLDMLERGERLRPDLRPELATGYIGNNPAVTALIERVISSARERLSATARTLTEAESAEALALLQQQLTRRGIKCPTTTTSPSPTPTPSRSRDDTATTPPAPQSHPTTTSTTTPDGKGGSPCA